MVIVEVNILALALSESWLAIKQLASIYKASEHKQVDLWPSLSRIYKALYDNMI